MLYLDDEVAELLGADTLLDPHAHCPFNLDTSLAARWVEGRAKAVWFAVAIDALDEGAPWEWSAR